MKTQKMQSKLLPLCKISSYSSHHTILPLSGYKRTVYYNSTTQQYNSTRILLWSGVPLKAPSDKTTKTYFRVLTPINSVLQSHRKQLNDSDCRSMSLLPCNHNAALKWAEDVGY